jgi:hypothetical protein
LMRPHKPGKKDRKHPDIARDAMEDIKILSGTPNPLHSDIRYSRPNRDRALGEADRTGRHYDEHIDEGAAVSRDHEAD